MEEERKPATGAEPPAPPASGTEGATASESAPPAGAGPQASKEELATDLSEIARQRLSGSDKTTQTETRSAHMAEEAEGVAGKDMDDETAAAVESRPGAVVDRSHPGPIAREGGGPAAATPAPAPQPPTAAPKQYTPGGSASAPSETKPSGTGTPTVSPSGAAGDKTPSEAPNQPPTAGSPPATGQRAPTAGEAAPDSAEATEGAPAQSDGAPARPAGAPAAGASARPAGAAAGGPARPAGAAPGAARPAGAPARPGAPGAAAAPAKPPEPDPAELPALKEVAPDLTWERRHGYVEVKIRPEQLQPMARKVKSLGYDYLSAVTGVDWRDRLEMLYHIYSYDYVDHPGCIVLRVDLPPEPNPLCPSLTPVWPGAEFQEREVYDLMGVKFVGHPDLRRILTEDRFPGHPLRKDWTFDYEYVLVHHLRHGAEGQAAPPGGEEGFRRV